VLHRLFYLFAFKAALLALKLVARLLLLICRY
jgi:hypothetical protein